MITTLSNTAIETLLSATEGSPSGGHIDIQAVLNKLLAVGYTSCRYYDVSLNIPYRDQMLILTAIAGDMPNKLGYKLPLKDSTLAQGANTRRPAFGRSTDPACQKYVVDLKLQGRSWVDVPVHYRDQIIGLIVVDWKTGERDDPSSEQVLLLHLIAFRIASRMLAQPVPESIEVLKHSTTMTASDESIMALMKNASRDICRGLSAAAVAIFEHNWQSNSLVKIAEEVNFNCRERYSEFPEVCSPSQTSLTWQAWEDEEFRHVTDFEDLRAKHPEMVNKPCVNRHQVLLGDIVSILYSVVGVKEKRFLIRVINRVDESRLPFVTRHAELLEFISQHLSSIVDPAAAHMRYRCLDKTARALCGRQVTQRSDAMRIIGDALKDEGIPSYAVFSHPKNGTENFNIIERIGPLLKGWNCSEYQYSSWDNDRFYSKCVQFKRPKVVDVKSFPEHSMQTHLLQFLSSQNIEWVVVCPFEGLENSGFIACPVMKEHQTEEIERIRPEPILGAQREEILSTYAAMLGNALESIASSLTTENARNFIGHIGHEVKTPVAMLGQEALYIIDILRRHTSGKDPNTLRELMNSKNTVQEQMRTIEKTMEVATLFGQTTKKRLELDLKRHNVLDLLKSAQARLRNELHVLLPTGERRTAEIEISASCERMGEIVCDRDHLLTVLHNVIGNGIKYSLPRPGHQHRPMVVKVKGFFQTNLVIFEITNHGRGIAPEDREPIFLPFRRGTIRERSKITRGMGLGLYISRRIAVAHGGSLFCQNSDFVLDNPARKAEWEGYDTTFELRLSRTLQEGVTEFIWDEEA